MSTHTLRVLWPILDEAMYDDEAIVAATFEWPKFPERYQVTIVDQPRMKVIELDADHRRELRATRAVVCEAPVIKRTATERKAA